MRSHGDLRVGADGSIQRLAQRKGLNFRFAVQYLRALRSAARPHWKPRRSIVARGPASGRNEFLILCGEYRGWSFFQLHVGGAQQKCAEVSQAVAGAACGPAATPAEAANREKESNETRGHQG